MKSKRIVFLPANNGGSGSFAAKINPKVFQAHWFGLHVNQYLVCMKSINRI
jgi:hypothetical protein